MTAEIRVYVEGGGDGKDTKARLRTALGVFLGELRDRARRKRIHWQIIACGGRTAAFDNFQTALRSHPNACNVLLVDSEGPVGSSSPWEHLASRAGDRWANPGVGDQQCHLMAQAMEAWLLADGERLAEYYGQHFIHSALPNNRNVEQIDKDRLVDALQRATRHTRKGEYHKTRHAPEILERIRPAQVRRSAPFCDRLFQTLTAEIDAP